LNEHEKKEMLLKYQIQKAKDEEIARQLKIAEEKRKAMEEEKRMRAEQDKASESFIKVSCKKCPGCQSDVEVNKLLNLIDNICG
jgi:predicted aldo/keto reductase-like oxidoreductase